MTAETDLDLPLRARTPRHWVAEATRDRLAFLQDHAHLERKAASNALDLLGRWPARVELRDASPAADRWVHVLTSIAQDELRHMAQVLRYLEQRGGHLERAHRNAYAAALHAEVRRGKGPRELLDRLVVSALIELRSYERFVLLADAVDDPQLAAFYGSLQRSERGHYTAFLELARSLPGIGSDADHRFEKFCTLEAEVARAQPVGPAIHSGWSGA